MYAKQEDVKVMVRRTVYYSDDGVIHSEDMEKVKEYEQRMTAADALYLYTTKARTDCSDFVADWVIYRCTTKEEFTSAVSKVCLHKHVYQCDIDKAMNFYKPDCHFYAFWVDDEQDCIGDNLTVKTLDTLLKDYDEELECCRVYTNDLHDERKLLQHFMLEDNVLVEE